MRFLIDGYNLLHALDPLPKQVGPKGLHHARLRMLALLRGALGDDTVGVTVVFDAAGAPPKRAALQDYGGLDVRFAVGYAEADDLIELLISRETHPQQLTIVSDDHRLQKAARHRPCAVLGCGAFLDWLDEQRRPRDPPPPKQENAVKPERSSAEDTAHWLREFADLQDSPEMREAFNPFDFEDDET